MDTSKRTKELPMTVPDVSLMVNKTQSGSTNHKIGERKEPSCCDEMCKQHSWLSRNDVRIVHVSICIVDYTLL